MIKEYSAGGRESLGLIIKYKKVSRKKIAINWHGE